ncbi:Ribose-5-phosphate isomerase [Oopsacas minuta]|uniref:ribose-5-phosphate isomerase n=1 Tax=Oopsacas minuta TaxID=111878 RepID=A0AAV7JK84_9METZ|nr:Ribose-5-phosphate isomerase [Oopsacas minuta]
MAAQNLGKQAAAIRAITDYVKNGQVIGIGSGSTIVYGVQELAKRVKSENLSVKCIPTSFQAQQLIIEHALPLTTLEQCPVIDVAFDGADEIDKNLTCIKGGGGCLTQEKIVAYFSRAFVVMADSSKRSDKLGTTWMKGLPIEVLPLAYKPIQQTIEKKYGGNAVLRIAQKKAGPLVTDSGNFILDWEFPLEVDLTAVANGVINIPGVLEHGLFVGMTECLYLGHQDGSVDIINKQKY